MITSAWLYHYSLQSQSFQIFSSIPSICHFSVFPIYVFHAHKLLCTMYFPPSLREKSVKYEWLSLRPPPSSHVSPSPCNVVTTRSTLHTAVCDRVALSVGFSRFRHIHEGMEQELTLPLANGRPPLPSHHISDALI